MISTRLWVRALDELTQTVASDELLGWLLVLRQQTSRRRIAKILASPRDRLDVLVDQIGMLLPVARFLIAFSSSDRTLKRLPVVIDEVIAHFCTSGRGSAVCIRPATISTAEHQAKILASVAATLPQPLVVTFESDRSLIGGGILTIGSRHYNLSTAGRLAGLRQALTTNNSHQG